MPFVYILDDRERPEENAGLWNFEKVSNVAYKNREITKWHGRTCIHLQDYVDDLIPTVVQPFERFPELAHRSLFCSSLWLPRSLRDPDSYHKNNVDCPPTKQQHRKVTAAIEADKNRMWRHELYIFPEPLDNYVFSEDAKHVKVKTNDIVDVVDTGEGEQLEVLTIALFVDISCKGSKQLVQATPEKKKKLFGHRTPTK